MAFLHHHPPIQVNKNLYAHFLTKNNNWYLDSYNAKDR